MKMKRKKEKNEMEKGKKKRMFRKRRVNETQSPVSL